MELLIVVLAVFLIFRAEIKKSIDENWEDISANAVPLIKYFGSSILLTTALGLFPSLMMVVYMRAEGFFAYELFNGDTHAFNVLSGNIFLNYLILSFGFYGSVLMIAKKASKIAIAGFGIFNTLFILYFVILAVDSTHWALLAIMLVTTLLIAGYAYFMVSSGIKGRARAWYVPLIAAAVLMVFPVMFSPYASQLARVSLSQMKVGGLNVKIAKAEEILKKEEERTYKQMWLVLRTPEQLYLKDVEDSLTIMTLKSPEYLLSMKAPVAN